MDNLEFSNPANVVPPQKDAIGFPDRSAGFDVLPGFKNPPRGYGQVPFYWWIGDPLTKERLSWQLEQLDKCGEGIMGLQINYAHGYHDGGLQYGLSIPSYPPLFSEAWWELVEWFMGECRHRGWSVSLSDYTLGPGQGWCFDELLKEHPEMDGATLYYETLDVNAGDIEWELPTETLMVAAYPLDGDAIRPDTAIDLRGHVTGNVLKWHAPTKRHRLVAVAVKRVKLSLDPMHPDSGRLYAEKFFGQFEKRFPGEAGRGLNFFFSDELNFNLKGHLWNDSFAEEFHSRKGYDIVPELPSLFMDCGSRTPKVRLDYSDVMVALSEEGFFKPVFDWHQSRGMIYGCDHGGRGKNVTEFGDYFRTQRWNQGPGCDQPNLSCDLIKNKVASSIAHLYQRPRVWLEGYYGSGWGTSTEGLTRATFANFAQGQNLLSLHGLYYSTHGGYWEWAPPCNHFRMPYWPHMKTFLEMVQRLSYVMSQGYHCCDVAILYPVAAMEAGLDGKESVDTAFDAGHKLYSHGIDFDFIDFESLDKAEMIGKELHVSKERYRVLVLPAMRAIRWSTLQKALEFQNAGGLVIMLGALPEASDRVGSNDSELNELVNQFSRRVNKPEDIVTLMEKAFLGDFAVLSAPGVSPNFMHRKIGPRDLFMIHNAPKDTECRFRSTGKVELWDPWIGDTRALPVLSQTSEDTCLRLPLSENEVQLIIFSPGKPIFCGKSEIRIPKSEIELNGDWEFELEATMDNRFGDFHWPPTQAIIGAEARRFRYADELAANPGWEKPDFDDSSWTTVTNSFGPKFWKLGPLPENVVLDEQLAKLVFIDPAVPVKVGEMSYYWKPYEFSWRWGVEGNPGRQGWHGLKENISDDFIILGMLGKDRGASTNDCECLPEPNGTRYYLWTSAIAPKETLANIRAGGDLPFAVWLNGRCLDNLKMQVTLKAGANPLLLRYDRPGRGHFVLESSIGKTQDVLPGSLAMKWFNNPGLITYDIKPHESKPAGWYRFIAPPGLRAMTITAMGEVQAWVEGKELSGKRQSDKWSFELPEAEKSLAEVALRISQRRGCYGGAALTEPITLDCGFGLTTLGDWSKSGVLECYSGGAWYRKTVTLTEEQSGSEVTLDMGSVVASAELRVNGQLAGVRVSPPWRFEITGQVKSGDNRIEILVYNTLSNHYLTIPTGYRGDLTSGLLGPAKLVFEPNYRS